MIHEYRIYSCVPLRLPRVLKRFEDHSLPLWKKHGIRQVGFWQVLIGDGSHDIHYLLEWESLAEREQRWTAFLTDPDWIRAKTESEKDGAIVANIKSMILQPTTFSALR